MRRKGFVLMETIIVITVLCVVLVTLYGAYSKLLIDVNKKSLYDKTEYIYKTNVVRDYLENLFKDGVLDINDYTSRTFYEHCRNSLSANKCYDDDMSGNYENDFFKFLKVEAVYITLWNVGNISENDISGFEATTQNYIKKMDPTDEGGFRIIVMFKSENNDTDNDVYEYATLRFGGRV